MSCTPEDISRLLVFISAIDNRRATPEATLAWHAVLGAEYDYPDLLAAAQQHFATSTEYLVPGHLAALIRALRAGEHRAQIEAERRASAVTADDPARVEAVRQRIIEQQRRKEVTDGHAPRGDLP